MEFKTTVEIKPSNYKISHQQKILLLGSCFSDNIGEKFMQGGFCANVNPLGTLYNPASISSAIAECDNPKDKRNPEFFNWLHSKADLSLLTTEKQLLEDIDTLTITFGTSWIYRLKENNMIVANCKKQPDRLFVRECLSVQQIIETWKPLIEEKTLQGRHIIFTVSPIRHKKDGYHQNQISKANLLIAVDQLCQMFPDRCEYFPSYEIMMDELRDYRFYAEDMVHPSSVAVNYIWERFQDTYFTAETRQQISEAERIFKASQHRPINN